MRLQWGYGGMSGRQGMLLHPLPRKQRRTRNCAPNALAAGGYAINMGASRRFLRVNRAIKTLLRVRNRPAKGRKHVCDRRSQGLPIDRLKLVGKFDS